MGIRTMLTVAVCAATALTGGVAVAAPGGAQAGTAGGTATTTVREDFNGDGYQDVAVGSPQATVDGQLYAGYITIAYGSAQGLGPARTTTIDQNTPGVPGEAGEGNGLGFQMVPADLDHDGLTDLALYSNEWLPELSNYGSVIVLWGRTGGMTGKDSVRIPGPESGEMGNNLIAGDFNGDGKADLMMAHGSQDEYLDQRSVLYGPFNRSGKPAREQFVPMFDSDSRMDTPAKGDFNGDGIDDLITFYGWEGNVEDTRLWLGTPQGLSTTYTRLPSGRVPAVGDFDHDGKDDLALRLVPNGNEEDYPTDPGTIRILYGSASGPGTTRSRIITQDTAGVPGVSEKGDQFGARMSAGDVNGDGYDDLAVGVPFEALESKAGAGAVVLLKGGPGGLSGTGAKSFHQDTAGVPGVAEKSDHFGGSVRLLDVNKDGKADLTAGAPGEDLEAVADGGAVWSLRGASTGLTTTGALAFNPVDLGLLAKKSGFGQNLAGDNGPSLNG
ncbi:FG-GAP and VCBS repeat-containing protein [Streptomyces drozdowiczii]|uniref:FG-GAP-like repeat-containing protein n=1 Tax=Streptomyces drozdowiczii TaxID=202862 RepID=A0ABY6PYI2_9ACTN|nr:FG-GAP and VCBS repeat-containing protein [Streptomyces drozdowiczii]MCX0242885.1 FG-GAP-like repeat-containing protein [Streptomyces drozdowiczii]UZK57115.1 FG-GAP-like repeat-containing protein [Streptomyces drozdowiczii]